MDVIILPNATATTVDYIQRFRTSGQSELQLMGRR